MYFFTGGGYGGWPGGDGISNGTSTIGISKTQPVEVLEQHYPILFERYALREGSSGDGESRGGLGLDYAIRLLAGERHGLVPDGSRPCRAARCWPGARRARPTVSNCGSEAKNSYRRSYPRAMATSWPPATASRFARRAAAAMGLRSTGLQSMRERDRRRQY